MRQFIYLDTDIVNSILAQKEKGLVLETASEQEDTTGKENTKTGNVSAGGSAEGGIWKLAQAQAELNATVGLESNNHSQTVLKEIVTKTLHDAAFDIAYKQIKEEYNIKPSSAHQGSFVELNEFFEFVDLEYLEYLFSDGNGFLKLIDENNDGYKQTLDIVKAIRYMVPYKRMLVSSNGYLIPLEDKYFRDNPQTMGFKHGSDVTCFGYITNVINEKSTSSSESAFSQLRALVNHILISILPTKEKDLFVVHPIAIYYKG